MAKKINMFPPIPEPPYTMESIDIPQELFQPMDEAERVIRFVAGLNIRDIAERVMRALFQALAMHYEFSLTGITLPTQE